MTDPWSRLKHQGLGREISPEEMALARAIEAIYLDGVGDFAEVARRLTEKAVVAPASRRTDWDVPLLEAELSAINQSLDEAYARHGIGA